MSELHSKLAAKVHASEGSLKAEEAAVDFSPALELDLEPEKKEEEEAKKTDPVEPLCPEGTYLGVFLHQIIRKDGTYFRPDEFGCFHPETKEEKDLCEYYVSVGRCAK